jgi:hypothetical protein
MALILACVTLDHFEALDQDALVLVINVENLAAPALLGTGDDDDLLSFFDMSFGHN